MRDKLIQNLKNNHFSGASEILKIAAEILLRYPEPETISKVQETHPDMAPLFNLCQAALHSGNPQKAIRKYLMSIESASKEITLKLNNLINNNANIMTYSRSSTVKKVLIQLHRLGKKLRIWIPESRPGYEGRMLANELGSSEIHATLSTDMAAASVIKKMDAVLIGADRITPPYFVNKVGTTVFLLCARHYQVPVYLLSDQSKYIEKWTKQIDAKQHDSKEVCEKFSSFVHVVNTYFEEIPLELVTEWIK